MTSASEADPSARASARAVRVAGGWRGAGAAVLAATLIALALFLAFLALSQLSLRTSRAQIAAPVAAAFADGALDRQSSWRYGDTVIGAHQYNDCLILFQAMDDRAPAALRAVSPLSVPVDTDNACALLADFAGGRADPPTRHYHQYLHAHTSIARLLVPSLGVSGLRGLYKLAVSLTLLAGIGYALLGLVRGRRMAEHAAWLAALLVFARWFGLESFGQSLGHGPADLVLLAFLLFLQRASADTPLSARTAIIASAVLGALTIQFEFLTGGLPLGLAVVIGALPLALPRHGDSAVTLFRAVIAYGSAAAATVAMKLALIACAFGPATLIDIPRQFLFRTGLGESVRRDTSVGGQEFFSHIWAGLESLTPGMHVLAFGTLVIACVAGGWGYRRLRASDCAGARFRAAALLASMLVPPLWLILLWQHSAEHGWFMDRILAWPIAAGAMLFILALDARLGLRTRLPH
jgi:hypothetical protein